MSEEKNVPNIRFKGFTDPWEQRKLGDVSSKVTEKNKSKKYTETLTNSAEYGIINQYAFFDKSISNSNSIASYYVVKRDNFVYNPRISTAAPVGPINRNRLNIIAFMKTYGLDKDFKLNLEGNHANLAGHTYQHEIRVAREAGMLGSLDANQGDKLIGWDIDEYPSALSETIAAMFEVVENGSIGPRGGLNFDAKPRRQSFAAKDLLTGHMVGMDSFAAGLRVAAKMKEDGVIENILNERYGSFNSGIGKQIDDGKATIEEMEDYVIDKPQKDLLAATHSGHLEQIKDTINHYMIEVLAK
ncbi:hypothetical protein [Pediococcus acidilactici]|jgi:hypothetical protein|uniref:hypothetical protein n=1 Tax=Pediococcus acidilactici TaxID=1254 RepID=UPI0037CB5607